MNKVLFLVGIFLIVFSMRSYIKTQWVCHTGIQVYNEQDLYNAVDNIQNRPWWKSKNIVIRARHLCLDRDITVYNTIYFADTFRSITGKTDNKRIHNDAARYATNKKAPDNRGRG